MLLWRAADESRLVHLSTGLSTGTGADVVENREFPRPAYWKFVNRLLISVLNSPSLPRIDSIF